MDARLPSGSPPVDLTTIPSVDGRLQHRGRITRPDVQRRSRLRAPAGHREPPTHGLPTS